MGLATGIFRETAARFAHPFFDFSCGLPLLFEQSLLQKRRSP
jgi:hypothetical protein